MSLLNPVYFFIKSLLLISILLVLPGCVKTLATEDGEDVFDTANYDRRGFGLSAKDLLSPERFTSLKVEVQYMKGFKPDEESIVALRRFLHAHLQKPDGIRITINEIQSAPDTIMSRQQVIATEKANRTAFTKNKELTVYVLYTNTDFTDKKTLGWAYGNTSIALYGKAIKDNSGKIGKPSRTTMESTILLHEMGHLMGLLHKDVPLKLQHKDATHESHCSNRNCLMYYGIDLEDHFGHLIKRKVPELDKDCLEVLETLRTSSLP